MRPHPGSLTLLLWFAGLSFVLVVAVFRDAALDERLVMGAACLPAVLDLLVGGVRLLHTLVFPIAVLAVVMLATIGRRSARRRLLAVPIGLFMNLVLDGMWSSTRLIAWPLGGWSFGHEPLPTLDRSLVLKVTMELVGVAALVWQVARFRLLEPENRARFVQQGRLDRDLLGPTGRS